MSKDSLSQCHDMYQCFEEGLENYFPESRERVVGGFSGFV